MSQRILFWGIIIILISGISFQHFYLEPLKTRVEIGFDKQTKQLTFSFRYPVPKGYFLKNIKTIPKLEGKFIFENNPDPPFHILGYKKVRFLPENIERDKIYKIRCFEKEFSFFLPSPKPKEITFSEEKRKIEITFFDPIEQDYFFKKFKTEPKLEGEYIFLDSNTKIIFKPYLIEEDKDYNVKILDKELTFRIESPKIERMYFDKDKKEIKMIFTKPISQKRLSENLRISPYLEGRFIFDNSQTQVVFKPNKIEEGKNYKIEILGRELEFKLEPQSPPRPRSKSKPKLVSKEKFIDIDLSEQRLRLYQKGRVTAEYLISSGKPGMRTPTGRFQVLSKEKNHWSVQYGLYMPYSLRFYNGYYIHELPYWPGGYREGEEHLGIPVSHGCVRVGMGAAQNVYNFADIGTPVIIHK
ncbi:L,D-transpeptidase [bacterium]|nr:L,D-transpeptidase [bacterium]